MLKVKIKKLVEHAKIPEYSKNGDAGLDLVATDCYKNNEYGFVEYGTGLSMEIPEGHVGLIFPRSSISKTCLSLCNSVGVVDSGYRGEITFRMSINEHSDNPEYDVGDRIGQLIIMPYPKVQFVETEKLSDTERGTGGYGSTGA